MQRIRFILIAISLLLLASGCATSQFTNLTPSELERSGDGLYPFEVAFSTRQRSMEKDTIEAFVVIEENFYPMTPTKLVADRWETLLPIDPTSEKIYYRYKLDYLYKAIPDKRRGSTLSDPYQLDITE